MSSRVLLFSSLALSTLMCACQSAVGTLPSARLNQASTRSKASLNRVAIRVQNPQQTVLPGEIVLRYQPGVAAQSRDLTLQSLGLQRVRSLGNPELGLELVKLRQGENTAAALQALSKNPQIAYAEPNYVVSIPRIQPHEVLPPFQGQALYPNDPMYNQQYAHRVSSSEAGLRKQKGSEKVAIAIIDTGVDLQHPDLAAKILPGYDAVDKDDQALDGHGHGTHCAGIAAAITNNEVGVAGFAPQVGIIPVRVLDNNGSGSSADVAEGILWAADHGAQVISMSLGSYSESQAKEDAVKYALNHEIVVVAAMGNDGNKRKIYPAAQPGVIAVGSTDSRDKRSYFSNYGSWISVSAPGSSILSTFPTYGGEGMKDYGSISGTSMATPAVAGVAAMIRSEFPNFKAKEVRAQLEWGTDDLGTPGYDEFYGHGRINLAKALTRRP